MSVLRCLQQAMHYAIQKNIHPEDKWSSILRRVHDVWRVYWEMPGIRCYKTNFLRKDFDGIQTVETSVTVLSFTGPFVCTDEHGRRKVYTFAARLDVIQMPEPAAEKSVNKNQVTGTLLPGTSRRLPRNLRPKIKPQVTPMSILRT